MNSDVLTVRQFAKIAGVSYQSVYKRINHPDSTIQPYIVNRVNPQGKRQTYLKISILDDPRLNPSSQPVNPVDSQPVNRATVNYSTVDSQLFNPDDSQPVNPVDAAAEPSETASGSVLVDVLTERISDKDAEIKRLVAQLETKDKQIERLTDSLQFEQRRNADLTTQIQLLQAHDDHEEDPEQSDQQEHPEDPQQRSDPQQAKSFFEKLKAWWNGSTPQA